MAGRTRHPRCRPAPLRRGLFLPGLLACWALAHAGSLNEPAGVAGEWLTKTWETEDGLPENSATAMVQAADGHLWFGTWNGLVRFDGVKFTVFTPENTPGLPGAGIVNLHLDRQGRLWASTLTGLAVRNADGWRTLRKSDGSASDAVRTFSERAAGGLLLTTFGGQVFEAAGERLTQLPAPPGREGQGYLGAADGEGRWWVAQSHFVGFWDGREWRSAVPAEQLAGADPETVGIAADPQGSLWLLLGAELRLFREGAEVSRRLLAKKPESVWSLCADSRSNLWVCTSHRGLSQITPDGELHRWASPEALTLPGVRFVFEDREGNLWVGTNGGGLSRLQPRRFRHYGREHGLSQRIITSVSPGRDHTVWIATYGRGLFRLQGDRLEPMDWPGHPANVQSVLCDRAGRVWVGTFQEGLWMSPTGDTLEFRRLPDDETAGGNGIALFEDSRGRLWLSGGGGIARRSAGRFDGRIPAEGQPIGGVCAFAEDAEGAVWFTNRDGVFREQDGRVTEVRDAAGRALRGVLCFHADPDGTMWLGTERRGLARWRAGNLRHLTPGDGLPVTGVNAIAPDAAGHFWLTSSRGIVRVARAALEAAADGRGAPLSCQWLDGQDGLPSPECAVGHQPTWGRDEEGLLWFATQKGVAVTDPARFRLNVVPPMPQIERLVYHDTTRPEAEAVEAAAPLPGRLVLPSGSRRLEIHYTAPAFAKPDQARFQVRMDDESDAPWREVGSRRIAYFDEVAPGEHVFRVRAANADGVGGGEAALAFFVPPRFWQTPWFAALVGSAVAAEAALLAGVVLLQRRRRRAEAEVQRQRTELAHVSRIVTVGELTASLAHELNHPHSAILSNAQAGELFLNAEPPELDEVRRIFADIVRDNRRSHQILTRLRAFLKKRELAFEPLDLHGLIHEILPLIAADARARGVSVQASIEPGLPPVRGDRVHLQQVLLNLLINALDALDEVPPGRRSVHLEARSMGPESVEVQVRDTGPGIEPARLRTIFEPYHTTKAQGMGMGLSIARTLVEAHGGRIRAENAAEGGAVLAFTLPVSGPPHD